MTETGDGNQSAFLRLFDATASWVYGMAMTVLADAAAAEDAASDVYLELWRTARRFEASGRDASVWIEQLTIRQLARRVP
jgi:RNA polymerase sigma-70 factor (ECF subfamily)